MAPSSAVPVSEIAHGETGRLPDVAVPFAVHAIVVAVVSVPEAVPANCTSPHVALNDPVAVVAVCCVGFHRKFVQVDGDGMIDEELVTDCHVPMSAATPVEVGLVMLVLCSNPTQPAVAAATAIAKATM